MAALPLPDSLFTVYLLHGRDCLWLHILWDLALGVHLSCTALRCYFKINTLVWTAALQVQKEGCEGVGSSFWPPLQENELLLEQLYHVLLLLLLACTLSLDRGFLDTPDILYSLCTMTLVRSFINLTSKLPVTVLAKLLIKVLKHNDTLTLSFSLVKSIRLTL